MRTVLLIVAALSPWSVRRLLLCWLCNGSFGKNAHVGRSYIDTDMLVLGDNAQIGSGNVFRGVHEVRLDSNATIGNLNWLTGSSHKTVLRVGGNYTSGRLIIQTGGAITNRHYLDLHGDIRVGRMSILAGIRSTYLTHSIDFTENKQAISEITIGDYVFIGTNSVLLPGTSVPEKCVLAAGCIARGQLPESQSVYGGVPAKKIGQIDESAIFFRRTDAFVE